MPKTRTQLHLLYGNDEVRLNDARLALVQQLLEPEDRDTNLSELRGPGSHPLRLERALSAITGELAMMGLLPDVPRVLVVHDLADFFETSGRKPAAAKKPASRRAESAADPVGAFAAFARDVLPTTPNVAIFVCLEDEERSRQVAESGPLFELFRDLGETRCFREKPIVRDFEEAFWKGDLHGTLEVLGRWRGRIGSDNAARLKLYRAVSQGVELLLQARCALMAREEGLPAEVNPPANAWPSLGRLPDFRRRQANALAARIPLERLHRAVAAMHLIQRQMYPTGEEAYVPDWERTLDVALVELFAPAEAS